MFIVPILNYLLVYVCAYLIDNYYQEVENTKYNHCVGEPYIIAKVCEKTV